MLRKKDCRKRYKELRNTMSERDVREKSASICNNVLTDDDYKRADIILGYYPLGNEVDTRLILRQALKDGKTVALPKTKELNQMLFYVIHDLDEDVEFGAFSIMEPKETCECLTAFADKQVLALVPGVVFDEDGNRYGYGRGYYDRYFALYENIKRLALAYEFQVSREALEVLPTDVTMHKLITEQGVIIPVTII